MNREETTLTAKPSVWYNTTHLKRKDTKGKKMRIGIFGGTFDPFTIAHREIVKKVLEKNLVDKVLIVPTIVDYYRQESKKWLDYRARITVIQEVLKSGGMTYGKDSKIEIYSGEYNIYFAQPCAPDARKNYEHIIRERRYIHTLLQIRTQFGFEHNIFYTILGEDSYNNLFSWDSYEAILSLSQLICFRRGSEDLPRAEREKIPSTLREITPATFVNLPAKFAKMSATQIRETYKDDIWDGMDRYLHYVREMDKAEVVWWADVKYEVARIEKLWKRWAKDNGFKRFILGISGGKDSTVVAFLAARIFGAENVYGVKMPNGSQKDKADAERVFELTGINELEVNIESAFGAFRNGVMGSKGSHKPILNLTEQAKINLAPRIRMVYLYAIAQSLATDGNNVCVLNTDNLSERMIGYYTIYGDGAGSYAPLKNFTVTEVLRIGKYIGVPEELVNKKPGDGLQDMGDEERLGITYQMLDILIRSNGKAECLTEDFVSKCLSLFRRNSFKLRLCNIPGPKSINNTNFFRQFMDKNLAED